MCAWICCAGGRVYPDALARLRGMSGRHAQRSVLCGAGCLDGSMQVWSMEGRCLDTFEGVADQVHAWHTAHAWHWHCVTHWNAFGSRALK